MAIKDVFKGGISSVRQRFIDTFDRTNQASLGRSNDGSIWNVLRGTWSISTNKAVGADANYPMATQTMPFSNQEINIVGTTGAAASLWVTDANNWWAVGITQEPTSCNCTYYYNTTFYNYASTCGTGTYNGTYNGSNCNASYNVPSCISGTNSCSAGYNTVSCQQSACSSYNGSNCNNYAYNATNKSTRCSGSYNASNCAAYTCIAYNLSNCKGFSFTCNGGYNASNCNGSFNVSNQNVGSEIFVACNKSGSTLNGPFASCSTCYPQYVRVLQSVAGTVSVITQWTLTSLAASFKVKTSGSQITTSAYSDSTMVTQIGSNLVYTPTGVTITPTSGISIIPSSNSQQYSIDSIEIKKN